MGKSETSLFRDLINTRNKFLWMLCGCSFEMKFFLIVKEIPHWFMEWISDISFHVLSCKECIPLTAFFVLTKCLLWWDVVCGNGERHRERLKQCKAKYSSLKSWRDSELIIFSYSVISRIPFAQTLSCVFSETFNLRGRARLCQFLEMLWIRLTD